MRFRMHVRVCKDKLGFSNIEGKTSHSFLSLYMHKDLKSVSRIFWTVFLNYYVC